MFYASSGTSINSAGGLFSIRQVHYRAGQGAMMRATSVFDTSVLGNRQRIGMSTAADGFYFSYDIDGLFGVERKHDGHVIIQQLDITTPANGSENATITIDGIAYTVPLTAGTAQHNSNEISTSLKAQNLLWAFAQNNGDVICRSLQDSPATGSFTFSSATAVASFSEIAPGVLATTDRILQTDWNIDKMDGTGISGILLDPTKGNVYQIAIQYLGFGNLHFSIENPNTGDFQEVHQIIYANANTTPSVSNPTFRIIWSSENFASVTNATIQGASCAGFIQGVRAHTESGNAIDNTKSIGTSVFTNIITLRNRIVFGTNVNLGEIIPQLIGVFTESTKGCIINITKITIMISEI